MAGLSLDSGVLIALERRDGRARAWLREAVDRVVVPSVAAVALAECWRGGARSPTLAQALRYCVVRATDELIARRAGELLGALRSDQTIDAIVITTAQLYNEDVLTADPDDLIPLASRAGVRVLEL